MHMLWSANICDNASADQKCKVSAMYKQLLKDEGRKVACYLRCQLVLLKRMLCLCEGSTCGLAAVANFVHPHIHMF